MAYIYKSAGVSFSHSVDKDPQDSSFALHVHDKYEILCFVSGNATYLVEGHEYPLHQGCIMLMRPTETHRLQVKGKGAYERYVLSFRADDFRGIGDTEALLRPFHDRELGEKNQYLALEISGIDTISFFKKLLAECSVVDPELALRANTASLLCALNAAFRKKDNWYDDNVGSDVGKKMLAYINQNLCEGISLEDVSSHVHMSPSQVNRIFRKMTGTSVYDYILSKRFVMVRELISKGEPITSASQKCGFGDYSSFYRLYKKRTGHAPSEL